MGRFNFFKNNKATGMHMHKYKRTPRANKFFDFVTDYPKSILALGVVLILLAASQLPKIEKDTRVDAFIPSDHPALVYREKVKQTFGLKDPIVLAVVNDGPNGVFTPTTLSLVAWLVESLEGIENVDLDRITALSTENNIIGMPDGMYVEPFLAEVPQTVEAAARVRQAVMNFPLYVGSLVSKDGEATLIVFEVLEEKAAAKTYENVQAMLAEAPVTDEKLYLAGEAAVGGYWSAVIDRDSRRLQPLAGLVITLLMWLTFRTWRGTLLPLLVVAATALGALGAMAAAGVPFFAITNALPVILIGIAVADSIHILSQYYEERSLHLNADSRELVLRAMARMWRPVTVTSLTTMAGFWGIAISSLMPPMAYFGLFALLGVGIAWIYSLMVLPAALSLLKVGSSSAYRAGAGEERARTDHEVPLAPSDGYGRGMAYIGLWATRNAQLVCGVVLVVVVLGVNGALNLQVDRSRIDNINTSDPLYAADQEINERFDGTNYIDIVVEADQPEGLYLSVNLNKIEALQKFAESQPHVRGSRSIVDYLKQMHRAMSGGEADAYRLPGDENLIAQYFLLYSTTADPTDFEEEVDYDYQTANVRVYMDSGAYSDGKVVVEALQAYIDQNFSGAQLSANLSGRVTVDYHWIKPLARSHFLSVITALVLVLVMASVMFRSVGAGIFSVIPVAFAVLLIYAVMGMAGIYLEPSTSMFAAIAIGLGVDFSIHMVERMIALIRDQNRPVIQAMALLFPSTGRALFFNFAAIFFGFSTLLFSELPTISRFGSLIAVAVSVGFLASLFVLPALVVVFNPSFLRYRPEPPPQPEGLVYQWGGRARGAFLLVVLLVVMSGLGIAHRVQGEELPSGQEIARNINDRREGEALSQKILMTLTNRSGKQRSRDTRVYRQTFEDQERLAIYFEAPSRLKGTAFLTWDFNEPATEDAQWLYLPAARKVRRISAADRGDYFLGTDFTYEDIKKETKLGLEDYTFQTLGVEQREGVDIYRLEATPRTPALVKELGYSRLKAMVRADIWMPITVDYWDRSGRHLKTVTIGEVSEHQGIWTAFRIEAANHKTGHHTLFEYQDVSYSAEYDTDVFTEQGLRRGL